MLVRFAEMKSGSKTPEQYDCSRCRGKRRKCLLQGPIIAAMPARRDRHTIQSPDEFPALREWANKKDGWSEFSDFLMLYNLGICPLPFVTQLSTEAFNLYQYGQANNNMALVDGSYYNQPAFYMALINIIAAEQAQVRAENRGDDG